MIRVELRLTAVCEECRYEWTPTQYYSDALKTLAPELFRKAGAGNADGGAGNGHAPALTMNDIIRRAAGRG